MSVAEQVEDVRSFSFTVDASKVRQALVIEVPNYELINVIIHGSDDCVRHLLE